MNKKGFTLVELIAVIAVLVVLVLVALPNVLGVFNKSIEEVMKIEETQATDAGSLYVRDHCGRTAKSKADRSACRNHAVSKKIEGKVYFCLSEIRKKGYIDEIKYKGNTKCDGIVLYDYDEEEVKFSEGKTYLICDNDLYVTPELKEKEEEVIKTYKEIINDCPNSSYEEAPEPEPNPNPEPNPTPTTSIYTVTLDNAGGTSTGNNQIYLKYGEGWYSDSEGVNSIKVVNIPVKTGNEFKGYYTGQNGTGTKVIDENGLIQAGEEKVFNANGTLYASWMASIYKLTLNNAGATTSGTEALYEKYGIGWYSDQNGMNALTSINIPVKKGYTFNGYSVSGVEIVKDNGEINNNTRVIKTDTETTASYTPRTYSVILNNDGADTTGTPAIYLKYNTGWYSNYEATNQITTITRPRKAGYVFSGYYTSADGLGSQVIDSNGIINNGYTTLFNNPSNTGMIVANWTRCLEGTYNDGTTDNCQKCPNGKISNSTFTGCDSTSASDIIAESVGTCGLYLDEHGDYRYRGGNPCNYAVFNNEIWRIVGIFKTKTTTTGIKEMRIKLVRNSLTSGLQNGTPAQFNTLNSSSTATSVGGLNTLNSTALSLIDDAVWYIGITEAGVATNVAYVSERSGDTIIQKVGQVYLSDYGYASNDSNCYTKKFLYATTEGWFAPFASAGCHNNNWLKASGNYWTATNGGGYGATHYINSNGNTWTGDLNTWYASRAAVYLKANVKLSSGNGTTGSPYIFTNSAYSNMDNPTSLAFASKIGHDGLYKDFNGDYRYSGSNPNNYVKFNNETWRIVGLFAIGKTPDRNRERRIKIVRESLSSNGLHNGTESQFDALNSTSSSTLIGGINTLNSTSLNMIDDAVWYTGIVSPGVAANIAYNQERSTTMIVKKVGQVYLSDYGYASGDSKCFSTTFLYATTEGWFAPFVSAGCHNNNWLKASESYWTATQGSESGTHYINSNGNTWSANLNTWFASRAAVYLKANVKIKSGNGTKSNPYVFEL